MFTIDYKSRVPIYRQLVDRVEYLAARGLLSPGSQLPSVRALAVELSINPNTIAKAYSELEAKGVIYSVPGRGSFVSDNTDTLRQETLKRLADKLRALAEMCIRDRRIAASKLVVVDLPLVPVMKITLPASSPSKWPLKP